MPNPEERWADRAIYKEWGIDQKEVMVTPSVTSWFFILWVGTLGFVAIALAVDERFAAGKVVFAEDGWRLALGAAGGFLAFRAARGIVRTITRATIELGPEQRRRQRRAGFVIELIGVGFLLAALSDPIRERSIAFLSWTKPFYIVGGIFLVLAGLGHWVNTQRPRQEQPQPPPSPFADE